MDEISSITCDTGCIFPNLNSFSGNVTSSFSFLTFSSISTSTSFLALSLNNFVIKNVFS